MENENVGYKFDVIMLVDDDDTDNYINKRVISASRFAKTVITINKAENALEYLLSSQDLPRIIFLDLNFNGMNGLEFLREFAKLNEKIKSFCKVVVLSNFIHSNDPKVLSGNPHIKHYMEKPLTEEKLSLIK